jgi:hypothetical protein
LLFFNEMYIWDVMMKDLTPMLCAPALNTNGQFQAPGYDKPIPLSTGGASGSWGGGASGSWGSGTQNLHTFANPPPPALNPVPSVRSTK